jgi:ferredoxin
MDNLVIKSEKLPEMIEKIAKDFRVFAPVEENEYSTFIQIEKAEDINLEYLLPRVPTKSIFFKQTETLFKFKPGRKGDVKPIELPYEENVIFGIRPCDARSFTMLDPVFQGDFKDPFYNSKRENAIFIGLSCNQPEINCFCTSFDDSPTSSKNVDILFTDIGENYHVEVVTEKGEKLIGKIKSLFDSASKDDEEAKKKVEEEATKLITRNMDLEGIVLKLDKMFDHELWHNTAFKCIGCGICTYLCPTCHCFDMQDESTLKEGARIRVWDSCMYPEYTNHASGHNPRPARMNRVRNRVYHKFSYFPKNSDVTACTGCGRCIDYCPVNIDIIDVISKVGET